MAAADTMAVDAESLQAATAMSELPDEMMERERERSWWSRISRTMCSASWKSRH